MEDIFILMNKKMIENMHTLIDATIAYSVIQLLAIKWSEDWLKNIPSISNRKRCAFVVYYRTDVKRTSNAY